MAEDFGYINQARWRMVTPGRQQKGQRGDHLYILILDWTLLWAICIRRMNCHRNEGTETKNPVRLCQKPQKSQLKLQHVVYLVYWRRQFISQGKFLLSKSSLCCDILFIASCCVGFLKIGVFISFLTYNRYDSCFRTDVNNAKFFPGITNIKHPGQINEVKKSSKIGIGQNIVLSNIIAQPTTSHKIWLTPFWTSPSLKYFFPSPPLLCNISSVPPPISPSPLRTLQGNQFNFTDKKYEVLEWKNKKR